jgi:hypothetical protein
VDGSNATHRVRTDHGYNLPTAGTGGGFGGNGSGGGSGGGTGPGGEGFSGIGISIKIAPTGAVFHTLDKHERSRRQNPNPFDTKKRDRPQTR